MIAEKMIARRGIEGAILIEEHPNIEAAKEKVAELPNEFFGNLGFFFL